MKMQSKSSSINLNSMHACMILPLSFVGSLQSGTAAQGRKSKKKRSDRAENFHAWHAYGAGKHSYV